VREMRVCLCFSTLQISHEEFAIGEVSWMGPCSETLTRQ
jgi:hypothetical protein